LISKNSPKEINIGFFVSLKYALQF